MVAIVNYVKLFEPGRQSAYQIYTRSLAIVDDSGISEGQKEWVLGKTAATLFGI